jgi:hypothetical protein
MKLDIQVASTSQTINVFIQDSSSTTGAGLPGLVFNSAGLIAYYALPRAAAVAITLATLAAVTSAFSSGGFKEIDATHMPGWYRLDLPNAALASGRFVSIHLQGATNMAPLPIEIELTGWDNQDAVHGGLSALPNVASGSAGAIPTTGTGSNQISVTSGNVALSAGTQTSIADTLLNRDMGSVSDTTARSPLNALRALRNKVSAAGTSLTVTKEDDSTLAWAAVLTLNALATPITAVDPT